MFALSAESFVSPLGIGAVDGLFRPRSHGSVIHRTGNYQANQLREAPSLITLDDGNVPA